MWKYLGLFVVMSMLVLAPACGKKKTSGSSEPVFHKVLDFYVVQTSDSNQAVLYAVLRVKNNNSKSITIDKVVYQSTIAGTELPHRTQEVGVPLPAGEATDLRLDNQFEWNFSTNNLVNVRSNLSGTIYYTGPSGNAQIINFDDTANIEKRSQ